MTNFPQHFMRVTAPYAYNQVEAALDIFKQTDPDSASNNAFNKTQQQTAASIPDIQDDDVNAYLAQDIHASEEYRAFENEYRNLQNLDVMAFPSLNAYINTAQAAYENAHNQFKLFIAAQKKLFNRAYEKACPDQAERDALWKKHEKNLTDKVLAPAQQFSKDTHPDYLLAQAMIDYLDRLNTLDKSIASIQHGVTKKEYKQLSYRIDSNRKPLHIQHDKKTGKVSEIRVDALSGIFFGISGKPLLGDVGDAWATMVASHGKNVPIKIVLPISRSNHLDQMDTGLTQGFVLLVSYLFQRLERWCYENNVVEAGKKHGLNMDDVTVVDLDGNSLLSPKLRAKVKEQQEKWAEEYAKLRKEELNPLQEQSTALAPAPAA